MQIPKTYTPCKACCHAHKPPKSATPTLLGNDLQNFGHAYSKTLKVHKTPTPIYLEFFLSCPISHVLQINNLSIAIQLKAM